MSAAASKAINQETRVEGRKIIFRGGRGSGYSLEWESGHGTVRVSSRRKRRIFQVFRGFLKISGMPESSGRSGRKNTNDNNA